MTTITKEQLIETVHSFGGHLVILGAGASHALASEHNGDKNGKPLPLMNDLVKVTGVKKILKDLGYTKKVTNFEAVYSELAEDHTVQQLKPLNDKIFEYFSDIEIPDKVTNYDYLLAGLRDRDLVATFNWDPLIVQAYKRLINEGLQNYLPHIIFLHGNVAIGFCPKDHRSGPLENKCSICLNEYNQTPLLYPTKTKDYGASPYIKAQWDLLRKYLGYAKVVTIYGYSAPVSDAEAIKLMQEAWGRNTDRSLEQFELVIRPGGDEDEARKSWDKFIHTHHYHVVDDIMKSYIGQVPRRTVELWYEQNLEAKFVDANPYPALENIKDLVNWVQPLIDAEIEHT